MTRSRPEGIRHWQAPRPACKYQRTLDGKTWEPATQKDVALAVGWNALKKLISRGERVQSAHSEWVYRKVGGK